MYSRSRAGLLVFMATIACAARGMAGQGPDWVLLGQRQVSDRADHDLIPVTAGRGDFRRI
jgi:hypothetical protein